MLIKRVSDLTGVSHIMDIPVDEAKLTTWFQKPYGLVQDVFPELTADQREFLLTGITPEEWDIVFGEEE